MTLEYAELAIEAIRQAAMRQLDLVDPGTVVDWANSVIVRGGDVEIILELASMVMPIASEVDTALDALLRRLGLQPLDPVSSARLAVSELVEDIIQNRISPVQGAREIWGISLRVPDIETEVRAFIAAVSEWEDDSSHQTEYEQDIESAARDWIRSGT